MAISGTRAAGGPLLSLPATAKVVVLQLDLEGEPGREFSARLLSPSGVVIWTAPRLVAQQKLGLLELRLPAALLASGSYRLALRKRGPPGPAASEDLAVLPLQVLRASR